MQISNRMTTVGTTLFLAVATGHIMQNEDAIGARLHQLGLQYSALVSAIEGRTSDVSTNANPTVPQKAAGDRPDPTMARISAIGVKRVAKGVLVAASVGQDSETLSGDEGESMMHSDNGTDETGETVAVNVVTITK